MILNIELTNFDVSAYFKIQYSLIKIQNFNKLELFYPQKRYLCNPLGENVLL